MMDVKMEVMCCAQDNTEVILASDLKRVPVFLVQTSLPAYRRTNKFGTFLFFLYFCGLFCKILKINKIL